MSKKNSGLMIFFKWFARFFIFFVVGVSLVAGDFVIKDWTTMCAFIIMSLVAAGFSFFFDSDWLKRNKKNFLTRFKKKEENND